MCWGGSDTYLQHDKLAARFSRWVRKTGWHYVRERSKTFLLGVPSAAPHFFHRSGPQRSQLPTASPLFTALATRSPSRYEALIKRQCSRAWEMEGDHTMRPDGAWRRFSRARRQRIQLRARTLKRLRGPAREQ